ncbi:type II toxin-antitoxin system Phd/YefM family antitoxin [Streptomyces sp. NPDC097595]|uniref:type II toxin-antitoxin system Phd/YefM family antitoxin n=1 Tax=Streptomyces sp. NPDC097595 TaxID=3366090 RepID=UPI0037F80DBD
MAINASEARKDFFGLIRRVIEDHAPERVTSKAGTVVIMSEEDYNAWQETMYLLRSPRNAARLVRSIEQTDAGRGTVRDLIDTEDA